MTKDNRGPVVEGSTDPIISNCVLVPIQHRHRSFPEVSGDIPDATYYRYSNKQRRLECMVTVMPTGIHVGWDMCGRCTIHIRRCACSSGLLIPPSILHIYKNAGGQLTPREIPPVMRRLRPAEDGPMKRQPKKTRRILFEEDVKPRRRLKENGAD